MIPLMRKSKCNVKQLGHCHIHIDTIKTILYMHSAQSLQNNTNNNRLYIISITRLF